MYCQPHYGTRWIWVFFCQINPLENNNTILNHLRGVVLFSITTLAINIHSSVTKNYGWVWVTLINYFACERQNIRYYFGYIQKKLKVHFKYTTGGLGNARIKLIMISLLEQCGNKFHHCDISIIQLSFSGPRCPNYCVFKRSIRK